MSVLIANQVTAIRKLTALRDLAAKHGGSPLAYRNDYRYRFRSRGNPWNPATSHGSDKHCRWIEDTARAGLRRVGFADEILRLNHRGWFSDNYQEETMRGAVYQLPARHGKPRFAYGYDDPNNDGAAFLCFDPCDDKEDAARWADSVAERCADEEREYQAKDAAENQIAELRAEILERRSERRALLREIKGTVFPPTVCATLRATIRQMREESRKDHKRITKLQDNYWNAVPQ